MPKFDLDFALERGIINTDDVLNQINKMKKQDILNNHPFKIWKGKNGFWYTYFPELNSRHLTKKSTKEKIEEAILSHYKEGENKKISFHEFYLEWLTTYKCLKVANGSINRIQCDYNRFYMGKQIDNTPIKDIDKLMVDTFLHRTIKDYNLNRKQYNNMLLIIKQVLEYAILKNYIENSPLEKFKLASNILRKDIKKQNVTQVFMIEEKKQLETLIMKDFMKDKVKTIPLAILFAFQTGVRLGELVSLKWNDINDEYITIQRTEIRYQALNPDGSKGEFIIDIKDSPKSIAGNRDIFLTPKAKKILELINSSNIQNNYDSEFIFFYEKGRMHERCVDNAIRRYCKKLNINIKSMHKIRKTFISTLIDSGLNIDEIRRIAGHEDAQTTFNSYCYNRLYKTQTNNLITNAL